MHVVVEHAPVRAVTLESPLMVCTSAAVSSVVAAGADPVDPPPRPGMVGKVRPPLDAVGVGVDALLAGPHPAIPMIAPMERAPTRRGLLVIEFLFVVCQRSLRAESPQMIAVARTNPRPLPNRENDFTLVQSKQCRRSE